MKMSNEISLLVMAGSPNDETALSAVLHDIFPQAHILTVTNDNAIALAADESPDVILLDCTPPNPTGLETCRNLKDDKRTCDIPVVFLLSDISDTGDRIKALDAGAEGFLAKPVNTVEMTAQIKVMVKVRAANRNRSAERDHLEKLVAERTQALRESYQKLEDVFEAANVGKSITSPTGRVRVNKAFSDWLGYSREEMAAKTWQELTPPEDIESIEALLEPLLKGEKDSARFIKRYIHRNGSLLWADISTTLRRSAEGKPLYFITTAVDITERKRNEDELRLSEERFAGAFQSGPAGMTITRIADGKFIDANQSFCRLFGYDREEVINHTSTELKMWSPEERQRLIQAQMASGGLHNFELAALDKSGRTIHLLFSSKPIKWTGEACLVTTMIDITERKRAEEALRDESEERFASAFQTSPAAMSITRISDGKFIDVNQAFLKMLEFQRDEVVGHTSVELEIIRKEEREKLIRKQLKTGGLRDAEFMARAKSGRRVHLMFSSAPMELAGEAHYITTLLDITEREQLEQELQRFYLLAESSREFIGMCDLDLQPIYVNPAGRQMVGLPDMAAACRVKVPEYFFPEDRQFIAEEFFPRVLRDGSGDVEIRLQHFQTGEALWFYYYLFSVHDATGKGIGWATVSRDITERRRAEQTLRESEKRYRTLFENMNSGFVLFEAVLDEQGRAVDLAIVAANKGFEDTTGLNLRDSMGKRLTEVLPGIEKDEADWIGTYSKVALAGEPVQFEQYSELLDTYYSVSAFNSGPNLCAVTFLDITDKKKAEMQLLQSEERLRLSTELANIAVWEYRRDTDSMERSKNHDRLYGLPWQTKWKLDTFSEAVHPGDRAQSLEVIQKSIAPGGSDQYSFDFRVVHLDQSIHWLNVIGQVAERDLNGQGLIVRGCLTDITERKMAEEAMQESQRRLSEAQRMAQLGHWSWEIKTGKVEWSDEVYRIFRLDPDNFTPRIDTILELSPWAEDYQRDKELIRKAMENREKGSYEQRFLRPDQSIGFYYSTFQGKYDENGDLVAIVGTVLDITERKKAEEKIRENESRFRKLFEDGANGMVMVGKDFRFLSTNRAFCQMTGYQEEELQQLTFSDITHPDDRAKDLTHIEKMMAGETDAYRTENRHIRKDGETFWAQITVSPIYDSNEVLMYLVGIVVNVTERKLADEEIKRQYHELQRWHALMLDREDRVIELKQEVNEILENLGQSPRYLTNIDS